MRATILGGSLNLENNSALSNDQEGTSVEMNLPRATKYKRDYTNNLIIWDPTTGVMKRRNVVNECQYAYFFV